MCIRDSSCGGVIECLVRNVPSGLGMPVFDKLEFREKYINDNRVKKWIDLALRIEGTNKTYGVHAAGVVIASDPLDELVPLQRNNEGQIITQYSMDDIESLGLLRMDFLGLKNLTMIEKTVSLINQSTGRKINIDELPQNDGKTFELIGRGDLEGIFNLNLLV